MENLRLKIEFEINYQKKYDAYIFVSLFHKMKKEIIYKTFVMGQYKYFLGFTVKTRRKLV